MAQYLVVRAWLEEALGDAAFRHLVFTTDPARGALRELATREGIATLDVPPDVGGRFSVLSPVGLLPAALAGIDVAGAARRRPPCDRARRVRRPAAEPGRALCGAALGRRHRPRGADPRADAVHRPAARVRRVVPPALGREPGQAGGSRRPDRARRPDAAGRGRRHRPAQPGPALHGGAVRQGHHLRHGWSGSREDVSIPAAVRRRRGASRAARGSRLPARPHAWASCSTPSTRRPRRRWRRWAG